MGRFAALVADDGAEPLRLAGDGERVVAVRTSLAEPWLACRCRSTAPSRKGSPSALSSPS